MKLYEIDEAIDSIIQQLVNPETGEINPVVEAEIEQLEQEKENKLVNLGLLIKNTVAFIEASKAEERRLRERRQSAEKKIEWLKKYLLDHLDGDKIDLPQIRISTRNSKAVQIDPWADIPAIAKQYPDLVDVSYTPRKRAIREFIENNGISWEGIRIIDNKLLTIK